VLSPYQIGGLQLAQTALRPAVVDFVQLATGSDNLELNMEQVQIGECGELAGQRSCRPTCASDSGVIVVGIQRADGHMVFNPEPDSIMHPGIFSSCSGVPRTCAALRRRRARRSTPRRANLEPWNLMLYVRQTA